MTACPALKLGNDVKVVDMTHVAAREYRSMREISRTTEIVDARKRRVRVNPRNYSSDFD